MKTNSDLTRIADYIKEMLPWAHAHQVKALTTFVAAILEKQTGNQAALARAQGNQEAACKRLARLLHNPRLAPKALAEPFVTKLCANCRATAWCAVPLIGRAKATNICSLSRSSSDGAPSQFIGAPMPRACSKGG